MGLEEFSSLATNITNRMSRIWVSACPILARTMTSPQFCRF